MHTHTSRDREVRRLYGILQTQNIANINKYKKVKIVYTFTLRLPDETHNHKQKCKYYR